MVRRPRDCTGCCWKMGAVAQAFSRHPAAASPPELFLGTPAAHGTGWSKAAVAHSAAASPPDRAVSWDAGRPWHRVVTDSLLTFALLLKCM